MRANKSDEREVRAPAIDFFDITPSPISQNPYEIALRKNYPDVDDTYRFVWDRSDTSLPQTEEWSQKLQDASSALERASKVCEKLPQQPSRMTPRKLNIITKVLREADHRLVEIISDLKYSYPMANENYYSSAKSIPEIFTSIPKFIFCDADEFAFWLLELPPHPKYIHSSLILQEVEDMLLHSPIPRFKRWHMDCFHIYHPDRNGGVLDVDNYNFKPIIDTVALAMHAKDSRDNFSMSQYNIPDYSIKPGYYFHVYKRDQKVQILRNFQNKIKHLETP